jgi:hypothetical protein
MTAASNDREDNWSGKWIAEKIHKHDNVASVTLVSGNVLHVKRKRWKDLNIATMAIKVVTSATFSDLLKGKKDIDFVVNIPKDACVRGDALNFAEQHNFGFGGLGDLFRALSSESPRDYLDPEFGFVLRSLKQHSRVTGVTRVEDRLLRVERRNLEPVVILVLNDYELTAEHLRAGIERYGEFQAIVCSNPNSRITSAAEAAAGESKIQIFNWKEFFSQLNRKWTWKKLPRI